MSFQIFTRKEAAKQARISPRFLDMQIRAGCGPDVTRIGRRVLVRSDAFQAWIEGLTMQSRRREAAGLDAPLMVPAVQETATADVAHGQSLAPSWPSSTTP